MAPPKPCAAKRDCITPLKRRRRSQRTSEMARSDVTLNMMLDQATRIVDTSKWVIVDASSEFWIVDPRIEPTEENNWGAIFNGISTRQEAEAIIRNYNTPEE
jgi:hypothetical protein